MKKLILLLIFVGLSAYFFFKSYDYNHPEIEKYWWKYADGVYFGDVLTFDRLVIRNDTVFDRNKPIAIIFDYNSHHLYIKSLVNQKTGYYVNKGEVK